MLPLPLVTIMTNLRLNTLTCRHFYRPCSLGKQGDNALGSVNRSIHLFALSCFRKPCPHCSEILGNVQKGLFINPGSLSSEDFLICIHGHHPRHYTENIGKIRKIKSICTENTEKYVKTRKNTENTENPYDQYGKVRKIRKNTENTENADDHYGKIRKNTENMEFSVLSVFYVVFRIFPYFP